MDKEMRTKKRNTVGRAERNALVQKHLPFARSIARATGRKFRRMDIGDLEGQAYLGLVIASKKYDPERGAGFRTYATFWINRMLLDGIKDHIGAGLHVTQRMRGTIKDTLGTPEEPAWVTEGEAARGALSLDATFGQEFRFVDIIASGEPSPEKKLSTDELGKKLEEAIENLSDRDRTIVRHRFGIEKERETLSDVGKRVGVSRERVRQIETGLPRKIRQLLTNALSRSMNGSRRLHHGAQGKTERSPRTRRGEWREV